MDNKKYENIKFIIHPPIEFLYAMITTTYKDELLKEYDGIAEYKIKFNNDAEIIIDAIQSRQSRFLKSELHFFFDCDSKVLMGIGNIILWSAILDNPDISDIPGIIKKISETDSTEMFSNVVKTFAQYNRSKKLNTICDFDKIKDNMPEMIKLINSTEIANGMFKEHLTECLKNTDEAKNRFCFMINQFYNIYVTFEDKVLNTLKPFLEKYKLIFKENPEKFFRQYINTSKPKQQNASRTIIAISFFRYVLCDSWGSSLNNVILYALGAYTKDFVVNNSASEDVQKFFKAMSDKNRLDIIKLLSKKDLYVYELAEKLNMSAATVSYHLSTLLLLKIVHFERYDHRIYYSLDKERLRKLADDSIDSLLN